MQSNTGKIMSLIRERKIIYQTELAQILGIEKSTVSRIVKKLNQNGLLVNAGELPASTAGGRKSILLELNPEGAYAIAVELDVETAVIALVNQKGEIIVKNSHTILKNTSPDAIIAFLTQTIRRFLHLKKIKGKKIIGVGIAVPGIINAVKGEVISSFNFDGWEHFSLASQLSAALSLPVRIDNNVRLEAVGEKCFGRCRSTNDFLCISVHYGIGLGLFSNGQIFRGAHHQEGDIHLSLAANGPKCRCGRKGCIEALAGTKVILERYKNKGISCVDDICKALHNHDRGIEKCVRESGRYIGQLVAHLTELFDPKKVILCGPLINASDVLFNAVQKSYTQHGHTDRWRIEKLEISSLQNDAAIIGAAVVAMDSLFECEF